MSSINKSKKLTRIVTEFYAKGEAVTAINELNEDAKFREEVKEDLITVALAGIFLYMSYKLFRIIFWP